MLGIFLDLETTGLDPTRHSVIELALSILDLQNLKHLASYHTKIIQPESVWNDRDPNSIRVNGFTYEEICKGKPIELVREEVKDLLISHQIKRGEAVFICQNPSFDRAFFSQILDVYTHERLLWPYHWLDLASMFWVKLLEDLSKDRQFIPNPCSLSKDKIANYFGLPPEEKPHRAMNGVNHLIACYKAVVGIS